MADCIFCKIIAGKIPCYKVFENAHVLAFLNINPIAKGHTLVVPKTHHARLEDMPADVLAAVAQANPIVGKAIGSVVGVQDYNLLVNNGANAGQEVMHCHHHIIPRESKDDGLGYRFVHDRVKLEEPVKLAADIAAAISK